MVADNNGNFPNGAVQRIYDEVEYANNLFTNGMNFFICNISVLNNSGFYELDNYAEALDLFNTSHVDDAVNLYYDSKNVGNSGFAYLPPAQQSNRLYMKYANPSSSTLYVLAHELGHYFGLRHTFQCWDNPPNHPCPGELVNGSNSTTAGDYIIDTNAAPNAVACASQFCSTLDCSNLTDANGDMYNPDTDNIMSYFANCNLNIFTAKQMELTVNSLQNHPARTFLLNASPICNYEPVAEQGVIEAVKDFGGGTTALDNQPIDITVLGGSSCQESTLLNEFFPVNGGCGVLGQYGNQNIDVLVAPLTNSPATPHDYQVTTFDLIFIQKHILEIVYLDSPYKIIASDVNNSGTITLFDKVLISRVILEYDDEFTIGNWKFVPTYYLDSAPAFSNEFSTIPDGPFTAEWNQIGYPSYMNEIQIDLSDPIAQNENTWSFKAIKVGDANGSAYDDILVNLQGDDNGEVREFSADETFTSINVIQERCIYAGEWINLEFSLDSKEAELIAYQMGIAIDQNAFEIERLEEKSLPINSETFNLDDVYEGVLKTIWTDTELTARTFDKERKLFSVRVKALKDICDLGEAIQVDNEVLLNRYYDENGVEKRVNLIIESVNEEKITKEKAIVYPNPFKDKISFEFDLEQSEQLVITLYDVLGNAISNKMDGLKGRNYYTFENISNLKEGLLYYEIMSNNTHITGKVIKLKSN